MLLTKLDGESMRLAMTAPIMDWKSRLTHQALPDQLLAALTTTGVEPGHIDPSRITRFRQQFRHPGLIGLAYMHKSPNLAVELRSCYAICYH
ncbi:unnamed protein product [Rodentolepis nana]|uniref:DUF4158 domain-containing protein n=1 Tax=Rodentolepis nana TaxID=102285 RepID=A0A0R3TYF4_RODNA|nr:unnamed protein product [Rodentolepis nana]